MNIIIPMGGLGERFSKENYSLPKPLIYSRGKPMIYWLLDSLSLQEDDFVVIPYTSKFDIYKIKDIISARVKNVVFEPMPVQTTSVIDTLSYALYTIPGHRRLFHKTISLDCDTFYTADILSKIRSLTNDCCILYKIDKNTNPIYSYITMDNNKRILDIQEKKKISNNACVGCYVFDCWDTAKNIVNSIKRDLDEEKYISHLYSSMIKSGRTVYGVLFNDVCCIGTPMQLKLFGSERIDEKPLRFCFDLDNTLVSYPLVENDYSTVQPIDRNIRFLQFLKYLGHTIIIHTARRMRTHGGNNGRVLADIGKLTFDTLDKFNIPYDEIYFGKPDADFYIDDKALNCYREDIEKETGFYNLCSKERSFNRITISDNKIVKSSTNKKILGEIHWYNNIPPSVKYLFPKFYSYDISDNESSYTIEKIKGIPMSYLYVNDCMSYDHLDNILKSLEDIHTSSPLTDSITVDVYDLYTDKLIERLSSFDYKKFDKSDDIVQKLLIWYEKYKNDGMARLGVIHGDPVFSNILVDEHSNLKFVDMRGLCGDKLSIYGDTFYDYAKIYQSLTGYEHIVSGREYILDYEKYINGPIAYFTDYFKRKFSDEHYTYISYIAMGLYFTLIPLHEEHIQPILYNHILKIFKGLLKD